VGYKTSDFARHIIFGDTRIRLQHRKQWMLCFVFHNYVCKHSSHQYVLTRHKNAAKKQERSEDQNICTAHYDRLVYYKADEKQLTSEDIATQQRNSGTNVRHDEDENKSACSASK